jgi:hypothetical protein
MKAMIALWHQGEGKGQIIQTDDLRAFLAEFKNNPLILDKLSRCRDNSTLSAT